jgi:hypothetical protein
MRSAPAMTESSGRSRALWAGVGVALVVVVALVLWAF